MEVLQSKYEPNTVRESLPSKKYGERMVKELKLIRGYYSEQPQFNTLHGAAKPL